MRRLSALVTVALLSLPAAAQSQLQLQQQAGRGDGEAAPMPAHFNASLTHSIGSATFVQNAPSSTASQYVDALWVPNPTLSSALTLTPLFIYKGWTVIVNQSFGLEWTQSDGNTTQNELEMSDLSVGARTSIYRNADLGLNALGSFGYQAPLSLTSRQNGSVGTVTGGLRGMWNVSSIASTFYAAVNGGYTQLVPSLAARFASHEVRPYNDRVLGTITPVSCNPRNPQELVSYACNDGGIPSALRWGLGLGGSWSSEDGLWTVSGDLGYQMGFSAFVGPDDALTGSTAVAGLAPRQSTSGNLGLTWAPTSWFNLTVGANSSQPLWIRITDKDPLQRSYQLPRFPLWDFVTPYNNFSSLYVDTTFSL